MRFLHVNEFTAKIAQKPLAKAALYQHPPNIVFIKKIDRILQQKR
jgi:hypothetical protein